MGSDPPLLYHHNFLYIFVKKKHISTYSENSILMCTLFDSLQDCVILVQIQIEWRRVSSCRDCVICYSECGGGGRDSDKLGVRGTVLISPPHNSFGLEPHINILISKIKLFYFVCQSRCIWKIGKFNKSDTN